MMHRRLFVYILTILVIGALSCTRQGGERLAGHLNLRLNSNPTTLDPALITDVLSGYIAAKLFNGLVRFDEALRIVPDIAESWILSEDQRTYTFRLRRDVTFSNGRKVTARDFRYSFERVLTPETKAPLTWVLDKIEGARHFLEGRTDRISGITVVDDRTLVLRLEEPFGPFLSLLAMTTAYVVPQEEVERLGRDFGNKPVGTGPYVLKEWNHGRDLLLTRREDYFGGRPRLQGISYRVIPEDLTAVMEFETGGLDALLIPSAEYGRYTTSERWRGFVYGKPGLNTYYVGLNCTRPPFNDVRVRRAVNHAVDRERILNTLFEKRGVLAVGPVPPALWKHHAAPKPGAGYRYDPAKARELIRRAGAEGSRVTIYILADPEVLDIMEVIQVYLRDVGIEAEIRQLDWSAFKQAVNLGEPDAFWMSWWADYPDPENFLLPLFHSASVGPAGNRTRCIDPELDSLIDRAQRTVDDRQRYALYRRAEDRIIDSAPWIFMWHRGEYYVVQPWVRNFRIYPIYSIDKGMDLAVDR